MSQSSFGDWTFDPDRGWLSNGRDEYHLRPQTAQVLSRLLEASPGVVERESLKELLWPGQVVVDYDTGINACIKQIRSTLGETAAQPVHLWTIPKKGFRFVRDPDASAGGRRRKLLFGVICSLILGLGFLAQWASDSRDGHPKPDHIVAVMPFDDLAGSAESEQLRQVVLDQLIVAIGTLDPDQIGTISRRSVLARNLDQQTARDVGHHFGASHILEGTIRQVSGGHIVTVSLVVAADDRFLWGELVEVANDDPEAGMVILRKATLRELTAELQQP